jgi:rfaE bifunctional protein kinase chain/domain
MLNELKNEMLDVIDRWEGKKVILLGDLIADEYVYGGIRRISREAPVFIIEYDHNDYYPGGGGNTAMQIKALGGDPIPIGVVGNDEEGDILINCFRKAGICTDFIIRTDQQTIKKTRIIAGSAHSVRQQILRIDKGKKNILDTKIQNELLQYIQQLIKESDVIAISDYGYGFEDINFIQKIINLSKQHDKIAIADSRYQLLNYKGVYAATPNEPEVEAALRITINEDKAKLETAGLTLMSLLNCKVLLITRGKRGMALFEENKQIKLIDIYGTDQIVDVTGAGDTVLGTFALALSAHASPYIAAKLANYAGGIVVMKRGTAQASLLEIKTAIQKDSENADNK